MGIFSGILNLIKKFKRSVSPLLRSFWKRFFQQKGTGSGILTTALLRDSDRTSAGCLAHELTSHCVAVAEMSPGVGEVTLY